MILPGVIAQLTAGWQEDNDRWQRRDLSARRHVCIRADGVYLQARMEPQAECMLLILGAIPEGKKELVGFQVGVVFTLVRAASKKWRKLNGTNQLQRVIETVRFTDGVVADDAGQGRAA